MITPELFPTKTTVRFEVEAIPHFPVLNRLALHLARNKSGAEDLVQETFAQALKSFDRYETGTNCRAWLCRIMFNKRLQWIRANARFRQFDENETRFPAASFAAPLPHDYVGKTMSHALAALPEKFRQIVWLAEVEELAYREIAEQLNIPIGTVMSRLHRGRKMLRFNFHQFADQPPTQNNRRSI